MRGSLLALGVFALLGLAATFFVEAGFLGRAAEVQPVARDATSREGWKLVGKPVILMNIPPAAFVTKGGPDIPAQVDTAYLGANSRVVPLAPIRQTIQMARFGALITVGLTLLGWVALRRIAVATPE